MDVSRCGAPFEDSELRRFLDAKEYEGLERLRTENAIRAVTYPYL